ncbi:MAG: cation:proton antiporter [Proteobacteria bacterium]|nr:cation:proton antiporter [Pseudomonadota bacterium]MBU1739757.1 cation:proton antiporter [Pseudomonadota bacterium]
MLIDKVFILSAVVFTGVLCQWFAWRVKLPAILFLLIAGIIAGPLTGVLDSDALFGDLLFPFISLSVAVILFEGSLTLSFHQIAGLGRVVRNMISFGVLVTMLITAAATRIVFDFPWGLALLFGAITSVTGPTVIVPMLRTVRPTAAVANILRWEGIVIDPIGATLAVLVFEFILAGSRGDALGHTLLAFGRLIGVGLLIGALSGYLYGIILRRHWLPEFLHNVATLGLVVMVFAVSNSIQHESGLLTVTVMGIWLANMKDVSLEEILDFKESLSVLLISVLFIVLAARLDFQRFIHLGWQVVFIFLSIQFLSRPLSVMVSALGSKLRWPERHLLAWIAPRGIVSAAISALFAIKLEAAGFTEAELLVPLTFSVIIGTVVLQSGTAGFIARKLGVAEPEPRGFLVIGANLVARTIGKGLQEAGFRVLLVDSNWEMISKARMEGLETYYGEPVSEHADRNLDLVGIGTLLALSPRGALNSLSCMHYRMELGSDSVFAIQTAADMEMIEERKAVSRIHWRVLFGPEITFTSLAKLLTQDGWEVRSTTLSEAFDFAAYQNRYGGQAIPMFGVTPRGRIVVFTAENVLNPQPGWTLISLAAPDTSPAVG